MRVGPALGVLAALGLVAACHGEPPPPAPPSFDARAFLAGKRTAPDLIAIPPTDPSGPPWELKPLFDGLEFGEPVWAGDAPGHEGALYVLEHEGRLWEVQTGGRGAERRLVLDLSSRVFHKHEAGAEGFAFHPDFERNAEVFLFYVVQGDEALLDRLSRFRWDGDAVDPDSEEILIEQLHRWQAEGDWGEHFGGTLHFGPDGFLYIGIGDEGGRWYGDNPQRIDRNLFSGILRIDVDADPSRSHAPPRPPQDGRTQGYGIPNDNPFVGMPHALEEFWAIGLRNPWGFSFDRETNEMWIGDVGFIGAEEVNLGVAGGNYQWSYREGDFDQTILPSSRPVPYLGTEHTPLYAYPHGTGDTSIIGGAVVRGPRGGSLRGHYVFGDHGSGRIRSLLRAGDGALPVVEEIAAVESNHLLAFAQTDDEPILVLGRRPIGVSRLVPAHRRPRMPPPRKLSETGLFADVSQQTPAPGVLPYEINAPAFANGAHTRRWIALPGDGAGTDAQDGPAMRSERVVFRRDTPWAFPPGTVFVQHLEQPAADPAAASVPIETRLLVLAYEGPVYGVNYRWTEDGRDALRIDETTEAALPRTDADWTYAGPETCSSCHNATAGYVLGVSARQLARDVLLNGAPVDQLSAWAHAEMMTSRPFRLVPVAPEQLAVDPLPAPDDEVASVSARARAYLEVNCAPCHRGSAASFSAELDTPTAELVRHTPRNDLGLPNAKLIEPGVPERSVLWRRMITTEPGLVMPPVGRHRVDAEGVQVVADWIRSLGASP